jgi:predicted MPP superfamily phosphohydrolase
MAERARAGDLLRRAGAVVDTPGSGLAPAARGAWRGGFASGGGWMRQVLEHLRGSPLPCPPRGLNRLGVVKYGLAGGAALASIGLALLLGRPLAAGLCVPVFYAVEAQMVFLFPLALDGHPGPFRAARRWTRRAGGTLVVMGVVLPLACTMLLGGFAGRGFVRSWCLGCLAVCLWYEDLRGQTTGCPTAPGWFPLEVGNRRPLLVRNERVRLGLPRPVRLLYASDLHLGHAWTGGVPAQVLAAARDVAPDLVLLGGDLADRPAALPALADLVRGLSAVAPVAAVPGNHDLRAGLRGVRSAVEAGGGRWLPHRPLEAPVPVHGRVGRPAPGRPGILCTHSPGVFPAAAAAGYGLVLAGHLHGGQCVLATRRGVLYPAAWVYRWHGLRFHEGGATLLVSRGAADSFPVRFRCPREVILCEVS